MSPTVVTFVMWIILHGCKTQLSSLVKTICKLTGVTPIEAYDAVRQAQKHRVIKSSIQQHTDKERVWFSLAI